MIFTIEYLLRLWSSNVEPNYAGFLYGRLKFAFTPLALVDLLAIMPFFLVFLGLDFRFIRMVRLVRILRIAKLGRYMNAWKILGRVAKARREELVITSILLLFLLVISSSLMYYAENEMQPDKFPSILSTMWWAIATLTTVGYGDVYPVTAVGRLMGGIIAVLGVGFVALPTGILGSGFVEEIQKRQTNRHCPHCGREISEEL